MNREKSPTSVAASSLLNQFADPRFQQAHALAAQGSIDLAVKMYSEISDSQAERHYQDALVLKQRNNIQAAVAFLGKAVLADPFDIQAWMELANLQAGAEAERACRKVLELSPGNIAASVKLANLLLGKNQRIAAARILAAAQTTAGDDFSAIFPLASLVWQLGDFATAERHLRDCIQLNVSDLRAYHMLLDQLHRQDRLTDAEQLCRDYLMFDTKNSQMRTWLAQVLIRQQRWDEAKTNLTQLLNEDPNSVPLRKLYADMLAKSGDTANALELLKGNVNIKPSDSEVYLNWADMQHQVGGDAAAFDVCQLVANSFSREGAWGLNCLPGDVDSRLTFYQLASIAEQFCTGERALIDHTGLDIQNDLFELGQIVELFCIVIGQEHIDYLEHIAYPALAATEGFNELLQERSVTYNIYTTPADLKPLQGFLHKITQRGIKYRINVELLAFSQDIYPILTLPIIDQVKRSLALKSVVVMALPDAIISGSIHRVINDMKPFETVACAMPRINSEVAYPELKRMLSNSTYSGIDSRMFVRKSMTDFIHPQSYSALVSENNCLRYRDHGSYYSAQNWAPPPLCFYARTEMLDHMIRHPLCGANSIASFYAIDHDFIDSAFRTENLRLIQDSDYFFWAEFTHPARHTDFLAGRKAEDYYAPESTKEIFKHEFKWIYSD